ncbi:MAG TPA: FAD-dependent oxidoreductase [Magnetospirillaceae bacterium]|jgi:hypothetical protein
MTPSLENVYFIGPFGRRVSFASQQRRALNTVWALEEAGRISRGERIAVIGAGLAGITATIALAARGMRVFLYESSSDALRQQITTSHRYVHPTVNFWPEEELTSSTQFPFLDWAADRCDQIIRVLLAEWTEIHGILSSENLIQKYHPNTSVGSLVPRGDSVQVIPDPPYNSSRSGLFDAVMVTTGFGPEKTLTSANSGSYWEADRIEVELRGSDTAKFLCSGTGDGGLIDTLRLLHTEFNNGIFCFEIAHELEKGGLGPDIKAIELEAQGIVGDQNTVAQFYHDKYEFLLSALFPDGAKKRLDLSLFRKPEIDRSVYLVGPLSHPYSVNAAPIHKLLIAHALKAKPKVLEYRRGIVDDRPSDNSVMEFHAHDGSTEFVDAAYKIVRHGAPEPPISKFIPDKAERVDLKRRQEAAWEWLGLGVYPPRHFDFAGWPGYDVNNKAFAKKRLGRAERFIQEFANGDARLGLDRGRVTYRVFKRQDRALLDNRLPEYLFGIPVVSDKRQRLSAKVGTRSP